MERGSRSRLSRRRFIGALPAVPAFWSAALAAESPSQVFRRPAPQVTSADQVLNIMEFEALARDALPPAHFGYLATGADDDRTVLRNHEAFSAYQIRARRFNDLTRLNTLVNVLGVGWRSPVYLSAVSAMGAFHPDGELAVGRAAKTRGIHLMVASGSSHPPAAVQEAAGAPIWQQIYPTDDWSVTTGLVRRAEGFGASAIVVTADSRGARNNETLRRAMLVDNRHCVDCHVGNSHDQTRRAPLFAGLDVSRVTGLAPQDQSARFLDRCRALVKTKLLMKGVVTAEDARLAVAHGADGIIVSNHGGRNEETLRASIDCLPEIVAAVRGKVPVLFDGGVRRGTDVFKALALGATAVGIGRPYAWGLAAFGQPGVEAVIDILDRELMSVMEHAGTGSVADIQGELLVRS